MAQRRRLRTGCDDRVGTRLSYSRTGTILCPRTARSRFRKHSLQLFHQVREVAARIAHRFSQPLLTAAALHPAMTLPPARSGTKLGALNCSRRLFTWAAVPAVQDVQDVMAAAREYDMRAVAYEVVANPMYGSARVESYALLLTTEGGGEPKTGFPNCICVFVVASRPRRP
ncbi:hypothetical protein FVE85_9800 [Porphyridium purpureum]|uniref:Uncharacterized protein n=1 Tax=Porphyridium purpureum TaxID=35688 RepID=A0A5J4YI21_PORPP|nr:hypothetical protein FVE85_9800 [Porphyridium purpureum]|eukprot:POR8430..scf289_17